MKKINQEGEKRKSRHYTFENKPAGRGFKACAGILEQSINLWG
jgi:hypothetical protein